ncbi:MAG: adenosylcobinamide-GDP ribazoletransferase [Planctomycetota bacterium]
MDSLRHALYWMCPGRWTSSERGAAQAYHWFVGLGLIAGLVYTGAYRAVWRQFGEVRSLPLMPAAAVWLLDVGLLGVLLYFGASRTFARVLDPSPSVAGVAGERPTRYPIEILVLVILAVLKLVLLMAIPQGPSSWPGPGDWRSHFNWMYAHRPYRPLILAPMWGRWAMLLTGSIGRVRDEGDTFLSSFCASLSAGRVLLWTLPVTVLTSIYCGRRWMFGCIIACLVLAGTYFYGVLAVRRQGGQTRDSIRGAGLVGELIFLVAFEALAANIYTP